MGVDGLPFYGDRSAISFLLFTRLGKLADGLCVDSSEHSKVMVL